ncbi:hypothetical protein ACIPOR_21960 [Photobacterium damselae subsp. piscicida]
MKKKYDIPVKITEDFKPEESFEDYMKRWPQDLVFPECVIRHWIYEVQFVAEALRQRTDLSKWTFHKESFTKIIKSKALSTMIGMRPRCMKRHYFG